MSGPYFYPAPAAAGSLSLQTIMSSPETGASTVRVMYCLAISAARDSIDIANPYFVPDHVSIDLFRDAVKRGVRVRVMVAGISNDTLVTRFNSVRLYGALLDAGVELYEYNRTMMHHKIMMSTACGRPSAREFRQPFVLAQRGEQRLSVSDKASRSS